MTDATFEIPGSERRLDSGGLRTLGADEASPRDVSEEIIQVTVLLRPDPAAGDPAIPTTRDALRAARRPRQVDVDNVINFANANGLTVVDPDRVPRMVVLSGTVSKVTAAFGTGVEVWHEQWPWPSEQISFKAGSYSRPPYVPKAPYESAEDACRSAWKGARRFRN